MRLIDADALKKILELQYKHDRFAEHAYGIKEYLFAQIDNTPTIDDVDTIKALPSAELPLANLKQEFESAEAVQGGMRLIDAEALKAKWYEINDIDENDRGARFVGYTEIARLIDHAPTVSADAVQGEWIRKEQEINDCDGHRAYYWYECSVCGARPPKDTWKNEWHSNYCPSCGARMYKGGDTE